MPLLTRTIRHRDERGAVEYTAYTKEEADELGIKYKPWYECKRGDWGISDDNVVAECINVSKLPYQVFHVFIFGTGIAGRHNRSCVYKDLIKLGNPYSTNKNTKNKRHCGLSKRRLRAFAYAMVACGFDVGTAYQYATNTESRKTANHWGKVLMETQEGRLAVLNEVEKILQAKGVDKSSTVSYLLDAIKMAKEKGDLTNYNRAVETLIKIQGLMPKQSTRNNKMIVEGNVKDWAQLLNKEEVKIKTAIDIKDAEEVKDVG